MPNIRVDLESPLFHGQNIIFKSPTDCSAVTGLIAYYPEGKSVVSRVFQFADAHGNNVGSVSLFSENVLVKVILDTELNRAYVQNSDTNAYLEGQFASKAPIGLVRQTINGGASIDTLHTAILNQFNTMKVSTVGLFVVSFSSSYSPFKGQKTTLTVQKLSSSSGVIQADLHGSEVLDTPAVTLWNVIVNGALDEWEYDNPPFLKDVAYRTTERSQGKAVYKRFTDRGMEYRLDGEDVWYPYSSLLGVTLPEINIPVTSVNNKTGAVNLSASDVGAYAKNETYSKTEVNNLIPAPYTHPSTHPASMITETDAIKMFLATERTKLAGIEEQANKYIHPSTHPASMITGLNEAIGSFGYGKSASGSYSGAGTSNPSTSSESTFMSAARTITLPFAPNFMIVRSSYSNLCYALSPNIPVTGKYLSELGLNISSTYHNNIYCMLKGNILYTVHSCDQSGYTYSWMIA